MRYAIFSDVHANRQAWEAVRADVERLQVDTLVCLGDVVGYGPMPREVLTSVREATPNFVLGNHDAAACGRLDAAIFNARARQVIEWTRERLDEESIRFLKEVPLQMDGSGIQFVHAEMMEPGEFGYVDGLGPAELNLRAMTQPLGFIGHTHLPMAFAMPRKGGPVRQLPPVDFEVERGKRYIVNVGSVGEPRTTDVRASYVIYDDVEHKITFRKIVFDVEGYKEDLERTGLDIRPYFVQVVDAGRTAGEPVPAAAPQMALAQLPKVSEVVAGHHGRLVVGQPGTEWGAGGAQTSLAQPKSMPAWMVVLALALVLVVVGAVAMVVSKRGDALADGGEGPGEEVVIAESNSAIMPAAARVADEAVGRESALVLERLTVRLFAGEFEDLDALREADEHHEEVGQAEVPDGLIGLEAAQGHDSFGLVWEGQLRVRQTGEYVFSLASRSGVVLLIRGEAVLEGASDSGAGPATAKVWLAQGSPAVRLEYVHRSGDGTPGLGLSWKRARGRAEHSLVRNEPLAEGPELVKVPRENPADPPSPEPAAVRPSAPEKLAEDLLAYWSFDSRERRASRFVQHPDGSVTENLVALEGQRVQVLVPQRDIGTRWHELDYDASDWQEGLNGVGYEETPGIYEEHLHTILEGEPNRRPHSVYVRLPFRIDDPADYAGLALYMRCDDGFVAYMNGRQMASRNLPDEPLRWNSAAQQTVNDQEAVEPELFKVNRSLRFLKEGWNILAVHGLNSGGEPSETNRSSTSTDMLIHARLVALRKSAPSPDLVETEAPDPFDRTVDPDTIKGKVTPTGGKFGDAFEFSEGSIEVGAKDEYAIGDGSLSLSLWFTREPGSTDHEARRLISAGGGSDSKAGWALWISRKGDALTFVVGDGQSRADITAKEDSLTSGEWRHVAVTIDRDTRNVMLFLDGRLVADRRVPLLEGSTIGSNSGLSIGRNSDDEQHHRGKIDDLAVWRRVLVPEEIEMIVDNERSLGEIFKTQAE